MHENNARQSILYFRYFFQGALKFQLRVREILINAMSASSKNTFENFISKLRKGRQIERMKEEEREEIIVDELEERNEK